MLENLYGPTELTITITGHRWTGERALNDMVPIGTLHEGTTPCCSTTRGGERDRGRTVHRGPAAHPATSTRRRLRPVLRPLRAPLVPHRRPGPARARRRVAVPGPQGRPGPGARRPGGTGRGGRGGAPGGGRPGRRHRGGARRGTVELVVFHTGDAVPLMELARGVRRVLPDAIVPKRYTHLDEFPLNSNRKTDRRKLALLAGSPSAGTVAPAADEGSDERQYGER
ncbi:hypothetical protein NKH77_06120 [Streptomyces sp. M19]